MIDFAPPQNARAKQEAEDLQRYAAMPDFLAKESGSEAAPAQEGESGTKEGSGGNEGYFKRLDGWNEKFMEVRGAGEPPWPNTQAFNFGLEVAKLECSHVAVVLGLDDKYARYAAEALARRWLPDRDCRSCSHWKLTSYSLAEIISAFLLQPDRCLVIEASGPEGAAFLKQRSTRVHEAISRHRSSGFKLVLWLTHSTPADLSGVEGVSIIPLPENLNDRPEAARRATLDGTYYRRLFGAGLQNLAQVIDARSLVIEQELVRAAVLFGRLAPEHLEKVMSLALDLQTLLPPESRPETQPVSALELWRSNRRYFQERAGLVLVGGRLDFSSQEERQSASEAAWEDGQSMSAFFHRLEAAELLLTQDAGEDALVKAFVDGVAGLTTRMPGSLGVDWLRTLSAKYNEREGATSKVRSEEPTTWKSVLKSILQMLRGDRERQHLFERLGLLCLNLPGVVTESFLQDLIENGACPLAWRLSVELRGSRVDLSRFIELILKEEGDFDHEKKGADLPPQILRYAAKLCMEMSGDARVMHAAFLPLLPASEDQGRAREKLPARCALLLPVFCIRQLANLEEDELGLAMQRLVDGLPLALTSKGGTTLADYWCLALSDPSLGKALQGCDNRKKDDWRTEPAAVLFCLANLAASVPDASVAEKLKPLLGCIKARVPAADWRRARERWLIIRSYAMWRKTQTPITPKNAAERRRAPQSAACT